MAHGGNLPQGSSILEYLSLIHELLWRFREHQEAFKISMEEAIEDMKVTLADKLDIIAGKIDITNEKLDITNEKLDIANEKLTSIDDKLSNMSTTLNSIDNKLTSTNSKLDDILEQLESMIVTQLTIEVDTDWMEGFGATGIEYQKSIPIPGLTLNGKVTVFPTANSTDVWSAAEPVEEVTIYAGSVTLTTKNLITEPVSLYFNVVY